MIKSQSQPAVAHRQMKTMTTALCPELELLCVPEVASLLRVARITVYRIVEKGLLPVYRVSHRIRFQKQDVLAYLEKNRYGSQEG